MTRKPQTIAFWQGRLPHWEVEDGRYLITIHLRGAIPDAGRQRLRTIANELASVSNSRSPNWLRLQRSIFREMERWLDQAKWAPHFANKEVAEMVVEAIEHRMRRRNWQVFDFVVMPTHIHLFLELGEHGLKATLEDFKRWTGHRGAARPARTRSGSLLAARVVRPLVAIRRGRRADLRLYCEQSRESRFGCRRAAMAISIAQVGSAQ